MGPVGDLPGLSGSSTIFSKLMNHINEGASSVTGDATDINTVKHEVKCQQLKKDLIKSLYENREMIHMKQKNKRTLKWQEKKQSVQTSVCLKF